jgi:S-adenosylmethionine:tRNA ribosyltransferase-isomerase
VADRGMADLPEYLRAGDLLVFNDTRVVAARIVGSKPSGGRVEIFLERVAASVVHEVEGEVGDESTVRLSGDYPRGGEAADKQPRQALVQLRASKPIREGLEITTPGGNVRVLSREDELWRVETPIDALEFFETWGEVPLPPYIHRSADASDRERYQSIFAREKGAVAAPTASLHFDAPLVARLDQMGVGRAFVTLHVGAGTFQPLRTDDLDAHKMHAERVSVSAATWEAIQRTRAAGGRVIAVGTTVVRALESAALEVARRAAAAGDDQSNAKLRPRAPRTATATDHNATQRQYAASHGATGRAGAVSEATAAAVTTGDAAATRDAAVGGIFSGETRLFIRPGFKFQVIDAMVTNFHLPESTLLMLVSAFAGRQHVLAAYAHAVRERYRFFSYGDAMLVMPTQGAP